MKTVFLLCTLVAGALSEGYGKSNQQQETQIDVSQLPALSQDLTSDDLDFNKVDARRIGRPRVEVGDLGEEFGHRSEEGDATESDGPTRQGESQTSEAQLDIGDPQEQLVGYQIVRRHERVIPITSIRYKVIPITSQRFKTIPIITMHYRKQPITVKTEHAVNQQHTYNEDDPIIPRRQVQVAITSPAGSSGGGYGQQQQASAGSGYGR